MNSIYYINAINQNKTINDKINKNKLADNLKYLKPPPVINTKNIKSDSAGIARAYLNFKKNGVHLYHDTENKTLYVAGSSSFADWRDNVIYLLPGRIEDHNIYTETDNYLKNNKGIEKLVGHSAAADVVARINKNNEYETTLYNAPGFVDTANLKKNTSYINNSDIVSMFNFNKNNISTRGATIGPLNILKNHSYATQFGYNDGSLMYKIM